MSVGKRGIEFVIAAVDKFTAPLTAFNTKMAESTAGLRALGSRMGAVGRESGLSKVWGAGAGVGRSFGAVADEAAALGGKLALVGGGLAYGFKVGFVDVASQFEKFETVLNTLNMGDTAKSKAEMSWISDFAAKTPYELAEVTEAFVQLRSYGMEPMQGLLQTLGDTSSAMGKPLKQAVEAIADAVTGENERLKEFGIVGKKVGDKIVYSYTNAAGAQAKMMAKAGDRAAIQATLTKVWAEKYGGGMEKLSKTFDGMWSNALDGASRFANKIMANGAFDWMKGKLDILLSTFDRMSQDGSLDAWASEWGAKLTNFLDSAWNAGVGFAGALQTIGQGLAWTADLLGGWENLALTVAALMGVKLVVAVGQLTVSLFGLGGVIGKVAVSAFVMLGSAISSIAAAVGLTTLAFAGWALAIGAVVAAIVLIWKNWDTVIGWIKSKTPKWILKLFGADGDSGGAGGGESAGASGREGAAPGAMKDWSKAWGSADGVPAAAERPSLGAAQLSKKIQENRYTSLERKESKVTVDFANMPRGAQVSQSGAPVDMDVDWATGLAMQY